MNDDLKEAIMETACELCHWPHVADGQEELGRFCAECPLEAILEEAE